METIIAKWKKVGRITIQCLPFICLVIFISAGLVSDYDHLEFTSRWQMLLLMTGLGCMCALITGYLALWVTMWKLEIKNGTMIVYGFLKTRRSYNLSELMVKDLEQRVIIRAGKKTIAIMSKIMIENCDKIVSQIRIYGHGN